MVGVTKIQRQNADYWIEAVADGSEPAPQLRLASHRRRAQRPEVAHQAGHSPTMTLDVYSHVSTRPTGLSGSQRKSKSSGQGELCPFRVRLMRG